MKFLNVASLLIAGSMLTACGQTMDDSAELPPDPEFGLETMDDKADSFAVRPGSPEAEAVVNYTNREIADDAAGIVFRDEIDAKLHATAAKNIAKFRAGDDGSFGTADDRKFDDLAELDRVPYVGRSALMKLLELAEATGYFQRGSQDCADFIAHDRYNHYYISSYANLLEFENSRCTTVNGTLHIQISGTDLLPPAARTVRNLRYLKTINGALNITTSSHYNSIHFDGLETVTGDLRAESPVGRVHTLEFAKLKSAKSVYMSSIQSSQFPALEQNDKILLVENDLEGFTALTNAARIDITQRAYGTFNVAFPRLTEVGQLNITVPRQSRYTEPDVTFTGGFDKLENAAAVSLTEGKYGQFSFDRLTEVGSLRTQTVVNPYLGMTKLSTAGSFTSNNDSFDTGVHEGPAALETVGDLSITSALPIEGYGALTTVERNIAITTNSGVEGFNALTTMGGSVNLQVGRVRDQLNLNGFNKISYLDAISISANNAPVVVGAMFESLENTEGGISILQNGGFVENPVFAKLNSMGGGLRVDVLREGADMMPVLEIVDGAVQINRTPAEFTGFDRLENIEGSVTLRASVTKVTGLTNLTAIGGNLSVPRSLTGTELDDFLNQLTEFSGTINYN